MKEKGQKVFIFKEIMAAWWYTPVIPALGRQRQEY
jgi:hypothetical protein